MLQLCVLWTRWHHNPSWAVSVNLQEGKELGQDLLCANDKALSCFPTPAGCYISSRGRNSVQQLNQLQGLQTMPLVTQGETSDKASVTDIHKSSWTTQLLCLFTALEVV